MPATRPIICLTERSRSRRAELAAEVLLGDDVGRVLGPGLGELDAALLEGGVLGVADHRVADLPLDLVEGMDAGGREATFDDQLPLPVRASFAALLLIKSSPSSGFSGWTPHPRARRGRNRRRRRPPQDRADSADRGRVPANWR